MRNTFPFSSLMSMHHMRVCASVLLFAASSAFASVYTTADQTTLTLPPSAALDRSYALGWDGAQYIAVGNFIMTSPDGASWSSRAFFPVGSYEKGSIAIKPGRYVTGGGNESVHWSDDGITWTRTTLPIATTAGPFRVATNGTTFVGTTAGGVFTSPDAITWTHHDNAIPYSVPINRVRFLNGAFHIVADYGGLRSSVDAGQTWNSQTVASIDFMITDIAYSNGRYVVGGYNRNTFLAMIFTSTNATTWSQATVPSGVRGVGAVTGNGTGFIAAAGGPSGGTVLLKSADGITWTDSPEYSALHGTNDILVANNLTLFAVIQTTAPPALPQFTVTASVTGAGGSVSLATQPAYAGVSAAVTATPAAGYVINTVVATGCSATRIGNNITTSPLTASCSIVVTFRALCNLDIDQDNAVLPMTDGLLILRRMLGLSNSALINRAYNPSGLRTAALDIANAIDPMISSKTLDFDGNGAVGANTDGLLLLRALLGFGGASVPSDALGAAPRARSDWASIRGYLVTECGLVNLAP
jgi:hypothetical protein